MLQGIVSSKGEKELVVRRSTSKTGKTDKRKKHFHTRLIFSFSSALRKDLGLVVEDFNKKMIYPSCEVSFFASNFGKLNRIEFTFSKKELQRSELVTSHTISVDNESDVLKLNLAIRQSNLESTNFSSPYFKAFDNCSNTMMKFNNFKIERLHGSEGGVKLIVYPQLVDNQSYEILENNHSIIKL